MIFGPREMVGKTLFKRCPFATADKAAVGPDRQAVPQVSAAV